MSPRPRFAVLAAMAVGLTLSPTAISAQAPAARFTAELAAPVADARVVAGGIAWRCAGTTCSAPVNGTRPLRVCRELSRELGQVVSFSAGDAAMDEADLARCNG